MKFRRLRKNCFNAFLLFSTTFLFISSNQALEGIPASQLESKEKNNLNSNFNDSYIIGPGDLVYLQIFEADDFSGQYSVLRDGTVNLPLIGSVNINNLTFDMATDKLYKLYEKEFLRPILKLSLVKARPVGISLLGELENPGFYVIEISQKSIPSVINAIQSAGGITQNANLKEVILKRKMPGYPTNYKVTTLDLTDLIFNGNQSQNPFLFDGDVITLLTAEEVSEESLEIASVNLSPKDIKVTIIGQVTSPGLKSLTPNTPLVKAIYQAGGPIDWKGDKGNVELLRVERNGSASLKRFKVNLASGMSNESNPPLKDGDIVKVNTTKLVKLSEGVNSITSPASSILNALTLYRLLK